MATVDAHKLTNIAVVASERIPSKVLAARQQVLALSTFSGLTAIGTGNTSWEELGCVGYHPELSVLEATITIKRATGYSGGLCTAGSTEYVRFFVDYEDGLGYQDQGIATVQVHDISDAEPGPQHPLRYLVQLPLDADPHRHLCQKAVLPKVRAILSWNAVPPADPNGTPVFGNRVDTRIQLKPRLGFLPVDAAKFGILDAGIAGTLGPATFLKFKPVPPDLMAKAEPYRTAKAEHRLAFTAVQPLMLQSGGEANLPAVGPAFGSVLSNLKIDLTKFIAFLGSKANVDYEELTCVGLNPARDMLGAVIRVKKSIGYSGSLCENGSQEHVAFWADWNNSGAFEYLGTASVEAHDVPHTEPIDYAVQLPTQKILEHLESCQSANVVRIRAVLSWSSVPSTTDPWDLNTWGNRVDVLVQLRPGKAGTGIIHLLYDIGWVPMEKIDAATHLAYPGTPGAWTYRPWGGSIRIGGRIYGTGAPGTVHYRLEVRKNGSTEDWKPLLDKITIELMHPLPSDPLYPKETVSLTANAKGWRKYLENPLALYPILERTALLGSWNTSKAEQGLYDIRLQYTDGDPSLPNPPIVGQETITIAVNNKDFTTNPDFGTALNPAYDVDIVIQGGDCKLYPKGSDLAKLIDGRVRVIHPYFGHYTLELQPAAHLHGAQTKINGVVTTIRTCTSVSDSGDDGSTGGPNGLWTIANSSKIDPCGYTVRLRAWDRTILNGGPWGFSTVKAVGFAVF